MKKREDLKILLMQIRADESSRERELQAFLEFGKLNPDQIDTWKVFEEPHFDIAKIHKYDALFAGGSSDDPKDKLHLDEEEFPFMTDAMELFRYCKDNAIPVFASCMGLEIIFQAFGEELVFEKENPEQGFAEVRLTEAGKNDRLFKGLPDSFFGVSWHGKQAGKAPKGSIVLAETDVCPIHAFTYPGSKFYAFQFHPEFSDAALIDLLGTYASRYKGGMEAFERVKADRKDTSVANSLVAKYIDDVLLAE